jgi:hypothetical protein
LSTVGVVLIVLAMLCVVGLILLVAFFVVRYRAARDETTRIRALTSGGIGGSGGDYAPGGVRTYDELPDEPQPRTAVGGVRTYDHAPQLMTQLRNPDGSYGDCDDDYNDNGNGSTLDGTFEHYQHLSTIAPPSSQYAELPKNDKKTLPATPNASRPLPPLVLS